MTVFIVICLLIDCNNFFYKFLVWVPPNHDLLKVRIFLWGFAAIATSKEWYEYVSNDHCHRLGPYAWLTFYVSLIELSSVIKFQTNEFVEPFPVWVKAGWAVIGAVYFAGLYVAY
jgi:phosphatidylserine synthase 2